MATFGTFYRNTTGRLRWRSPSYSHSSFEIRVPLLGTLRSSLLPFVDKHPTIIMAPKTAKKATKKVTKPKAASKKVAKKSTGKKAPKKK